MIRITSVSQPDLYTWALGVGTYVLGRSAECDLCIDISLVSRNHARLEVDANGGVQLTDLGSRNGTFVSDRPITGTTQLEAGQTFTVAGMEFMVDSVSAVSACGSPVEIAETDSATATINTLPRREGLRPLPDAVTTDPAAFRALSELGEMLIVPDDEDQLLDKSLDLLSSVLPAQRFAICRAQADQGEFRTASCRFGESTGSGAITVSRKVVEELTMNGTAFLVRDARFDPQLSNRESIIREGTVSILIAPMYDESLIWGFLYVDTDKIQHRFTVDHLRFVATFANMLAAKIMNHRLLDERRKKEKLEAELKVASQIQQRLLTSQLPRIEGYRVSAFQLQCEYVGGDVYEVADLGDGKFLLMVADVSDKGIGASILASNILAAIRVLLSYSDHALLESVRRVSQTLLSHTRGEDYSTLFLAILSRNENTLRYVNAGHVPYPLLVRRDDNILHLEASGVPVGLLQSADWHEHQEMLAVGDTLVAFTDGVSDTTNAEGERYGEERLTKLVVDCSRDPECNITEMILEDIKSFAGLTPQDDDITLLSLTRMR